MFYKNAELYNVAEILYNDDGSISWMRVPQSVCSVMESTHGQRMVYSATGVELRFVLKGEQAVIRMSVSEDDGVFHVFRGGIQGSWDDHEVHKQVGPEPQDYVIKRSANLDRLRVMARRSGQDWDPEVIRIIFDRGFFKIHDILGDIETPRPEQCLRKTLLAYGSSITHGSNSIDMSHSWVSLLAHNLNMDAKNIGMAGGCAIEPAMADYIASEGEQGRWDLVTLELGINVLAWDEEKINERVTNMIREVAGRNPDKPVVVISPFYYCGDDFDEAGHGKKWRRCIERIVKELNYPNVTYINGLDMIGDMSFMSADEVHPNIYGVAQIAERLTWRIREIL